MAIGAVALAVSTVVVAATGGLAAGAVVSALNLACGSLGASIVSGAVAGTIGGATYQLVSSTLSGNDAKTVFQDTLTGGFTGGGVQGLTSSLAAGEDAKTTEWNTAKGIAAGATVGGSVAAVVYGTVKAGSKLLGTGVKACFIAGTLILTAGGLKKIEDIRAGDRVYTKNVESKEEGEKEVLQTFEREVDVLVHLWIDGEEIVTTWTHPFYVDGKGWTDAGKLTEQDNVLAYGERKLQVEGIWMEELSEPVKVYNFEVEEYHTYYVGETEVLVHNDNCGQGKGNEGGTPISKPNQVHHYATNKNKTYTPQVDEIANKYGLDLNDDWNKDLLPHQGRHANAYHEYVLDSMKQFDEVAQGDKDIFLKLFENMKKNVQSNPDMLYKDYWE